MEDKNIVCGDRFEGLVIDNPKDCEHRFTISGINVLVTERVTSPKEDRTIVGFLFQPEQKVRFRVDVLIPRDCKNACVSLNEKELIGYFSKDIPKNPEKVIVSNCSSHGSSHEKYSTLKPGEFQSINFMWEPGDILKFFFYY